MNYLNIAKNILFENSRIDTYEALICDHKATTNTDFEQTTLGLSHYINSIVNEKQSNILLISSKNEISISTAVAIMLSGNVYIPVDKKISEQRLENIIESSTPALIVVEDAQLCDQFKLTFASEIFITLDSLSEKRTTEKSILEAYKSELLSKDENCVSEDTAYCIYTSGSTGTPKGVKISHGNICAFFSAFDSVMGISEKSICLNTAELNFDVSLMDLFYPLFRSASVYTFTNRNVAKEAINHFKKYNISHFTAVSSLLVMITTHSEFCAESVSSITRIMTGAEVVNKEAVKKWLRVSPNTVFVNGYGPTETTVICSYYLVTKNNIDEYAQIPIGIPLENNVLEIESNGNFVSSSNIKGELVVSGDQVMQGYMNNAKATKIAIVRNGNAWAYRTGDTCYFDESGTLHYVGRTDQEFKINGYRVHLNEIKKMLETIEYVNEAVVRCLECDDGSSIVIAGILVDEQKVRDQNAFRKKMLEILPHYMVPEYVMEYVTYPKLANNKVDVKKIETDIMNRYSLSRSASKYREETI